MVINAAWGLGEAIVGGAVSPDTIIVDKQTGRMIRREIAEKISHHRSDRIRRQRAARSQSSKQEAGSQQRTGSRVETLQRTNRIAFMKYARTLNGLLPMESLPSCRRVPSHHCLMYWNGLCRTRKQYWRAAVSLSSCRSQSRRCLPR